MMEWLCFSVHLLMSVNTHFILQTMQTIMTGVFWNIMLRLLC